MNALPHLALMRMAGILTARREGQNVFYEIASAKIRQACSLIQGLEELFGNASAARRKSLAMPKERHYDQDTKNCVDQVFP